MKYWNNKLGKYMLIKKTKNWPTICLLLEVANKPNTLEMLTSYRSVYLKPSHGTGGYGISKLTMEGKGFRLQRGTRSRFIAALTRLLTPLP